MDEGCIGGIPRKGEYGSAKKSKYPAVQSVVFPRNGSYLVEVRGKRGAVEAKTKPTTSQDVGKNTSPASTLVQGTTRS